MTTTPAFITSQAHLGQLALVCATFIQPRMNGREDRPYPGMEDV